jgi:protein ImuB
MTGVSSRRYLSLWLRRLATDRLRRQSQRHADPGTDRPFVLTSTVKNARRLTAVNDAAARIGLRIGMSFADACAIHPRLECAEADPDADARFLKQLAEWCEIYTPLVGLDPPDGLLFDLTGVAHLFGGEDAFVHDLAKRLARMGLKARIGIADTVGAAWAAARFGKTAIVAAGQTAEAMAPLPLGALRLAPEIRGGLRQLGLKTVADLMTRPRAPLAARFGQGLIRRLDQMLGREEETIMPLVPVPALSVEQVFPEPLQRDEDLLAVLARLEQRLCAMLEKRGEGARQMIAHFFAVDGKVFKIEIGTSRPLRDLPHLHRLFTDKFALAQWDNPFGFDRIRLSVPEAENLSPAQQDWSDVCRGRELAHLVDRLSARLGESRVLRLIPQDTHVPELASVAVPASAAEEFAQNSPASGGKLARSMSARQRGGLEEALTQADQDTLVPARPLRLFERPEPVEAIAEVPDGPPVRFRWRRLIHEVMRAEGPERIAMPWWGEVPSTSTIRGDATVVRDYFRVQTSDGARLWLYREGHYDDATRPRWFVHGLLP